MQISLENFQKASKTLSNVIKETKLIFSDFFSNETLNNVYIKPENLQITGSFKIRGAFNKINSLNNHEKQNGLITSSAGNHAQGVAFAAKKNNVEATIVMPESTPLIKIEATKNLGAKVVLYGDYYDKAYQKAKELEKEQNLTFIHPFNDVGIITGQGTIALEVLNDLPEADVLLVPVGGGGLISGIAACAKLIKPGIKIIGVEPEGACSMKESLEQGKIIELKKLSTIADGVAVKSPGNITFEMAKEFVDEIITVSDFELMESFLLLLEKHKLIAENAAILPLAALKKLKFKNKNVVSIISGGNIDVLTISAMIDRGLLTRGRIFCFSVELPDKPGELLKISKILATQNANIVKLDHDQFKNVHRFMQVHLEVTVETNGHDHINKIKEALKQGGYDIVKVY